MRLGERRTIASTVSAIWKLHSSTLFKGGRCLRLAHDASSST